MCAVSDVIRVLLATVLAAGLAGQELSLRCRHVSCNYLGSMRYEVEDKQIEMYLSENTLTINCGGASVLESGALPRAEPARRVQRVELRLCPPPRALSLARVLANHNVTLDCSTQDSGVLVLERLPPAPPLLADHFVGLESLDHLELYGDEFLQPSLEHGSLAPLRSLRLLEMWNVLLPSELDVPASLPALNTLRLVGWAARRPAPIENCDALRKLYLHQPEMTSLPDEWVANCSRIEVLDVSSAYKLITLPSNLLVGANALTTLAFCEGVLKTLPGGLLNHSPNLRTLRLNQQHLKTLPSNLFSVARRLLSVDLSLNSLQEGAMTALAPLAGLTELNLKHNPGLGDVCGADNFSPIRNSTQLKQLHLGWTGVSRICRDWQQEMMSLEMLDLSGANMSKFTLTDLQFPRAMPAEVVLRGVAITALEVTRKEFSAAHARRAGAAVRLDVDSALPCDCRMYWTRRALDLALPALQDAGELRCADGRRLRDVPPERMECARPQQCAAAALPPACACSGWRVDHPHRDPHLLRVRCEHAGLYSVPRPRVTPGRTYELHLAHNNIAELHADDLPPQILSLDLRNNSLSRVDEETAMRLETMAGMLRLAGNPLECSCHAAPLLRALHARNVSLTDLREATCGDGRRLEAAAVVECPRVEPPGTALGIWLASGFAVLLAFALAAVAFLASKERRFFARAVLHRWGLEWRPAEPEDADRRYDAFVTFSHKDGAVVRELMAHLEPEYKLCVHARDWVPGSFIAEQVVESVRASRRTLALVSRHFLASAWARAEFREAHAAAMLEARPRLVVLLLEEPAALQMDEQLRRYIATQTYLRWGDPWFWDKLALALPRQRALPPAAVVPRATPRAPPRVSSCTPRTRTARSARAGAYPRTAF